MNKNSKKISGIYIHFPFCKIKCGYCDFYSIADREESIPIFIDSLLKEFELYFQYHDTSTLEFDSIFLGGGSPSLITSQDIDRILSSLSKYIDISNMEEITIEANPGESPKGRLVEYKKIGVNRISFGFQSLDNELLHFLDRLHRTEDCIIAFNDAREAGFDNINVDMIFNIPGQTINTLNDNLHEVLELEPEHISCYSLTVEKGTTLHHNVSNNIVKMPDENLNEGMYIATTNNLKDAGYHQYEVSSYCKKNKECIHNLHYWNLDPYLAFGPSAHGYNGKIRWWNHRSLDKYISDVKESKLPIQNQENLTIENQFNEIIMNGLKTIKGINLKKLDKLNFRYDFNDVINKWNDLVVEDNYLKLKNNNFMLLDEITSELFV